ncbi:hypothetical protein CMO96_04740 [Candidatus Woesebacteria bacterium]|nr:hypothetical protein [Candidatus Woesebacteria bacterium]
MNTLKNLLAIIFFLIWIPIGVLLLAGIIFLITANPLAGMMEGMQMMGGMGGDIPSGGQDFPSEEMLKQFMQQQDPGGNSPGRFSPPQQ